MQPVEQLQARPADRSSQPISRRCRRWSDALQMHGYRLTAPRLAVLRVLDEAGMTALDVLQIRAQAQSDCASLPIYIYSCRTCELEMEELYPLGEAPARGIRCPLCGGYFERDVALFQVGGRSQAVKLDSSATEQSEARGRHGVNCPCCPPIRRQPAGKQ